MEPTEPILMIKYSAPSIRILYQEKINSQLGQRIGCIIKVKFSFKKV